MKGRAVVIARAWFALTALLVVLAIAIEIPVSANHVQGHFPTVSGRLFNLFCFFTIQSNILVGATCLILAVRPHASSTAFSAFRLAAIADIAITGIVYHTVLSSLQDLDGYAAFGDLLIHTIVPIMGVLGWLLFGPRLTSWRIIGWAMLVPVAWLAFTMVRGPIVDYYPYPFLDVRDLGYARVTLNAAFVSLMFFIFAASVMGADWVLVRRARASLS